MNARSCCLILIALLVLSMVPSTTTKAGLWFHPTVEYDAGISPYSVAMGDLDGDSHPDLVTANNGGNDVSVLLGNGDGTFQAAVTYGAGSDPVFVAIGDLDGDSHPDLITANVSFGNVTVLPGNGDGTFQTAVTYGAGSDPVFVAIGDLDGDSYGDLALASANLDSVSVLINVGKTVSAELTCSPQSGTLMFMEQLDVHLVNSYTETFRIIDARIDVQLANGTVLPNWKSGHSGVFADDPFFRRFTLRFPKSWSVVGTNTFTLIAEDTTPAPFNQPPYPTSGDTATSVCEVVGIAP